MPSTGGIVVTLVHGTWGRGMFPTLIPRLSARPRWFEEKSAFRTQFQALLSANDLPVLIRAFHWSGSNSIRARQKAASDLAAKLLEDKHNFPEYTHAVIGHSHGGNVALAALTKLGDMGASWLLVSLATPFLTIKDIDPESPLMKKLNFFFFILAGVIMLQVSSLISHFSSPSRLDLSPSFHIEIIFIGVVLYLLSWLLIMGWNNELLSSKSNEVRTDASVLVLRSIDDEANLALVAGSIASRLSYLLLSFIYFLTIGLLAFTIIAPVAIVLGIMFWFVFSKDWLESFLQSDIVIIIALVTLSPNVLVVCMMIPLWIMALARSVNGRELLFGGIVREINLQSVPDSDKGVEVRTLAPEAKSRSALRHSIYENSMCGSEAAKWLLAQHSKGILS